MPRYRLRLHVIVIETFHTVVNFVIVIWVTVAMVTTTTTTTTTRRPELEPAHRTSVPKPARSSASYDSTTDQRHLAERDSIWGLCPSHSGIRLHRRVIYLDSWRFNPSQPQRIISGLRETFIIWLKGPIRQNQDRKNRVRKRRVVGRTYGIKYSWKGHKDRSRHKNRIKRSGQARVIYVENINRNIPSTWKWARG